MPSFHNIHRMPINIYFGDLEPNTTFYHDKINGHLHVGRDDYGKFNHTVVQEILDAWNAYKASHHFDPDRYRWYENVP